MIELLGFPQCIVHGHDWEPQPDGGEACKHCGEARGVRPPLTLGVRVLLWITLVGGVLGLPLILLLPPELSNAVYAVWGLGMIVTIPAWMRICELRSNRPIRRQKYDERCEA